MFKYVRVGSLNYKLSVSENGSIIFDTGDQTGKTKITGSLSVTNNSEEDLPVLTISNTGTSTSNILSSNPDTSISIGSTTTQDLTIGGSEITDGEGTTYLGISPREEAEGREVITAEWVRNRSCGIQNFTTILSTVADCSDGPCIEFAEIVDNGFDWGIYRGAYYTLHTTNFTDLVNQQTSMVMISCNAPLHTSVVTQTSTGSTITVDSTQGLYPGMTIEAIGCTPIPIDSIPTPTGVIYLYRKSTGNTWINEGSGTIDLDLIAWGIEGFDSSAGDTYDPWYDNFLLVALLPSGEYIDPGVITVNPVTITGSKTWDYLEGNSIDYWQITDSVTNSYVKAFMSVVPELFFVSPLTGSITVTASAEINGVNIDLTPITLNDLGAG